MKAMRGRYENEGTELQAAAMKETPHSLPPIGKLREDLSPEIPGTTLLLDVTDLGSSTECKRFDHSNKISLFPKLHQPQDFS
jgi:hypothetical protein